MATFQLDPTTHRDLSELFDIAYSRQRDRLFGVCQLPQTEIDRIEGFHADYEPSPNAGMPTPGGLWLQGPFVATRIPEHEGFKLPALDDWS